MASVLVVSSMPKAEDAYYILGSSVSQKLTYARADTVFAKTLASDFGITDKNPRQFYEVLDGRASKVLSEGAGRSACRNLIALSRAGIGFPLPIACIALGITLGGVLKAQINWFPALHGAIAVLCALKYVTSCATCPAPQAMGLDASLVGFFIYLALTVLWLGRISAIRLGLSVVCLAATICWQIWAWFSFHQVCLPCSAIGLLCGATFVSLVIAPDLSEVNRKTAATRLAVAAIVSLLLSFAAAPKNTGEVQEGSLAAFSRQGDSNIHELRDVGLEPTGRRRTIFIGAGHCEPCHNLLTYLDAARKSTGMGQDIEYYAIDSDLPDRSHAWKILPDRHAVLGTPCLVQFSEAGGVLAQTSGFSEDPTWLKTLEVFIRQQHEEKNDN